MTFGQKKLYFLEWQKARKALRALGRTPIEADAERHSIHKRVLGRDKSSSKLTNRELDLVLAAFRAISRPEDLAPQIDEANQPAKRCLFVIRQLCGELGYDEDYAQAIAFSMQRERKMPAGDLNELEPKHLIKIITALRKQVEREGTRQSPVLLSTEEGAAIGDDDSGDPF